MTRSDAWLVAALAAAVTLAIIFAAAFDVQKKGAVKAAAAAAASRDCNVDVTTKAGGRVHMLFVTKPLFQGSNFGVHWDPSPLQGPISLSLRFHLGRQGVQQIGWNFIVKIPEGKDMSKIGARVVEAADGHVLYEAAPNTSFKSYIMKDGAEFQIPDGNLLNIGPGHDVIVEAVYQGSPLYKTRFLTSHTDEMNRQLTEVIGYINSNDVRFCKHLH